MAWGRTRRAALLFLYALSLIALPVLHHDLDCHFKTPMHCPACVASPMASPAGHLLSLGSAELPTLGQVVHAPERRPLVREQAPSLGRAPPA